MILVDTSVWVDHLRDRDARLAQVLEAGNVLVHPFVIGELALGNLRHREAILRNLADLPAAERASDDEVLAFIDTMALAGSGIGYIDAHLLASARLMPGARLWTRDRRLDAVAERLGLSYR